MQEKLLRRLKCWPMILGRISCEVQTAVWVPLSHTASGKEGIEEVYFLPSLRMTLFISFLLTFAMGTTWAYTGERDSDNSMDW